MNKPLTILALIAMLAMTFALPASAAPGPKAYLVGSVSPLTPAQVGELQAAGAQVKHIYKNFGGAAAVIPDKDLAAVARASIRHLCGRGYPQTAGCD